MMFADKETKDRLNATECQNKDCIEKPTHALIFIESMQRSNIVFIGCENHAHETENVFAQMGALVTTQIVSVESLKMGCGMQ